LAWPEMALAGGAGRGFRDRVCQRLRVVYTVVQAAARGR
jgi:hypothetical protein